MVEAKKLRQVSDKELEWLLKNREVWADPLIQHGEMPDFSYTDFSSKKLDGANLSNTDLQGASLISTKLQGADLSDTNLQGAMFVMSNLSGASLSRADLRRAWFTMANLKDADVTACRYDPKDDEDQYMGIKLDGCTGNPLFIRHAKDQDYLAHFKRIHPWIFKLWKATSDCGRSLWQWITVSFIFAAVFALIFRWCLGPGAFRVTNPEFGFGMGQMLYYSIVTFTTLGFGDITPITGWAGFWVTLEVLVGYIMLGGLISIFANKLARRAG